MHLFLRTSLFITISRDLLKPSMQIKMQTMIYKYLFNCSLKATEITNTENLKFEVFPIMSRFHPLVNKYKELNIF